MTLYCFKANLYVEIKMQKAKKQNIKLLIYILCYTFMKLKIAISLAREATRKIKYNIFAKSIFWQSSENNGHNNMINLMKNTYFYLKCILSYKHIIFKIF